MYRIHVTNVYYADTLPPPSPRCRYLFFYIDYVCGNNFLCCSHRLLGVYYAEAIWTKQYLPWCRRIIYVDLMLTNSYVLLLSVYYLGKEWTKLA